MDDVSFENTLNTYFPNWNDSKLESRRINNLVHGVYLECILNCPDCVFVNIHWNGYAGLQTYESHEFDKASPHVLQRFKSFLKSCKEFIELTLGINT